MEESESFDVFLSHNSKDKPAVRDLMQRLLAFHITVWFDEDRLRPGIPWQDLLEHGIGNSRSVAVLVGRDGLGPWEKEEMKAALQLAVKEKRPVVPVLLPGAPSQPELPLFLLNRTWVDLRSGWTDEQLEKLVWGITGDKPDRSGTAETPSEPAQHSTRAQWFAPISSLTGLAVLAILILLLLISFLDYVEKQYLAVTQDFVIDWQQVGNPVAVWLPVRMQGGGIVSAREGLAFTIIVTGTEKPSDDSSAPTNDNE